MVNASSHRRDFFISYTSADHAWAEWIAWQLEDAGYSVIIQSWDFRPGADFVTEMRRAASETARTLAVLSPEALASDFVQSEWIAAWRQDPAGKQRLLIPVRVRECKLDELFASRIYLDLAGLPEAEARQRLLDGLKIERPKPATAPRFPGAPERQIPAEPDFPGPGKSAIKGLRAFGFDDAELFLQLQRDHMLQQCFDAVTHTDFRIGILYGDSGCGKTSFLQAGLWPMLARHSTTHLPVYVKFSNRDPLLTIRQALLVHARLAADAPAADFGTLLNRVAQTQGKVPVLLFDQFEQFFVHQQRRTARQPLIDALATWHNNSAAAPTGILFSLRKDFYAYHVELQQAMGYSLGPQDSFELVRFTPGQATDIFRVIADSAALAFDRDFVEQMAAEELAAREDGLISPVDIQILAWLIAGHQGDGQRGFNRSVYQKMGGIEGLLENFLTRALQALAPEARRQMALKVLLALIDLERNVRAGVLTAGELRQKMHLDAKSTTDLQQALAWLAQSKVRLITPVRRDDDHGYELAHERLIQPVRRLTNKELTEVDQANILLDRRVREWLGNDRSPRYLLSRGELRRLNKQRPYLVWGTLEGQKRELWQHSEQRVWRRAGIGAALLLLILFYWSLWPVWQEHRALQQIAIEYVDVPGGTFEMGDLWGDGNDDEKPVRQVTLSDFRMSKYEITNREFVLFLNIRGNKDSHGNELIYFGWSNIIDDGRHGYKVIQGYENHPATGVTWYGAQEFAFWIGARLPTEAEWEYAARAGGRNIRYPWGNNTPNRNLVNYRARYGGSTEAVGSYPPNALGLHDMAGNAWEWCQDWYSIYDTKQIIDPTGPEEGKYKVIRGGSFEYEARYLRCSYRGGGLPEKGNGIDGFRVVVPLIQLNSKRK